MEELTKTQLVMLALLVSFITSIATGIVTVTLLDQAPPSITQTINRVVERTVEKVVPGQEASVITKETTIVIKEENLIVEAVERVSRSLVRIGTVDKDGVFASNLGVGVLLSQDGYIATDVLNLNASDNFSVQTKNGKVYTATLLTKGANMALLQITEGDEGDALKFTKPSFGEAETLRLGQTVIAIGGLDTDSVATGIVSSLNKDKTEVTTEGAEGEEPPVSIVETLSTFESSILFKVDFSGGPLIDVDGFLVGLNIVRKDGDFSIPISVVLDILAQNLENAYKAE